MSSDPPKLPPPAAAPPPPGMPRNPAPRPTSAVLFASAPLVLASLLLGMTFLLFFLAWMGGTPRGDRLELRYAGTCAAEAQETLNARVSAMGLGEPELRLDGDELVLVATMPGQESDRDLIPPMLGRPGLFEVRAGDRVLVTGEGVVEAMLRLDESGMPYTWLDLSKEAGDVLEAQTRQDPKGELLLMLDGELLATRPNGDTIDDQQLRIITGEGMTKDRMRRAVDWTILIQHGPLPCALELTTTTTLAEGKAGR